MTPVRPYQAEWFEYVGTLKDLLTGNIHTLRIEDLITVQQKVNVHLAGSKCISVTGSAQLRFDPTKLRDEIKGFKVRIKNTREIEKIGSFESYRFAFENRGEKCAWVKRY